MGDQKHEYPVLMAWCHSGLRPLDLKLFLEEKHGGIFRLSGSAISANRHASWAWSQIISAAEWRGVQIPSIEEVEAFVGCRSHDGGMRSMVISALRAAADAMEQGVESHLYYARCPEDLLEIMPLEEAHAKAHADLIDIRNTSYQDGWPEVMGELSWGVVVPVQKATMVDREDIDEDDDGGSEFEYRCDYVLKEPDYE